MEVEKLINKYIRDGSKLHRNYYAHVTMVTSKSLTIANRLGLDKSTRDFIYEAAMLHDIGVVKVRLPSIGSYGSFPYIQHLVLGEEILLDEGLDMHAEVALRHCTPSLTIERIRECGIDLPEK